MSWSANSGKTWFSRLDRLGAALQIRGFERDAAEQQRLQRFELDFEPGAGELDRQPRSIPEPGVVMDIAVIGGADKGVDRHVFGHVGDVPAEHLADAQVAEKDRRAERNRAEALGLEQKRVARDMLAEDRRVLASLEARAADSPRDGARHHPDIAPRQQGFETGNRAREEPRLDHPKHRLVGQQRLGLAGRGDGHNDMSVVGREFEALDRAKDDVLELELRLARLQPFGAVEGDGNRRPFL